MLAIQARVPNSNLAAGFAARWNGNDAAASHVFNALSWLFPEGERFFVAVAREVAAAVPALPPAQHAELRAFVAQESVHARQHQLYNDNLLQLGFSDVVAARVAWLIATSNRMAPLSRLAIVCAYEHYTAALGDFLLRHPQVLSEAEPRLALLWGWHAVEETEHKAVCFDLYRHAGGGYWRRVLLFLLVTFNFSLMFSRQYWQMLREDGALARGQRWATARRTLQLVWGRDGFGWSLLRHGLAYWRPGFHPWQCDNRVLAEQWLRQHDDALHRV
ncbi:metal-dependent hydrolase [Vogesella sp. LIG4]|uniref:metal-dependent hydrolase n=1 Tax=Vogesella sp. LIG4 TaxID=1192162 RepID=UPI00081FB1A7|nr:metal-dependent hydrolase [Vogesella sp. LIG4]SCK18967.1 hypothetical protein PSELUDRAFT_2064 [Vogesella sp. LIG4]